MLVSRGHTPFRKRGKGSGNFFYSSLLPRTVECGTNRAYGKAGNGNEMESGNGKWKWKLETEMETPITGAMFSS